MFPETQPTPFFVPTLNVLNVFRCQKKSATFTGLSHPFLGMGPGSMELGNLEAF